MRHLFSRQHFRRVVVSLVFMVGAVAWRVFVGSGAEAEAGFTNFETEPVRPIALSHDGTHVYALNTPADFLEVFRVTPSGLELVGETPVGMRPVALAVRGTQVWVSNHLSDSVSVVDVTNPAAPTVVHTLRVGDEPRDIVVGGRDRDRVFVATANRTDLFDSTKGRALVTVFDADAPTSPPTNVELFGTKPRALAVSPDGGTVYAAIFKSGNGTTVVHEESVAEGPPTPLPIPPNASGEDPPASGLIVRQLGERWVDEALTDWSEHVPLELPDLDLFVIDATANPPAANRSVSGLGTVIFNMAVNPATGEVWASNTEARNHVRFEPNLRSHAVDNRVTKVNLGAAPPVVTSIDLNPLIDYRQPFSNGATVEASLATPLDIVFTSSGDRAYVAAFMSSALGVLHATGQVTHRIPVGFGPAGLALNEAANRLYVLNRLDATISIVDTASNAAIATVPLHHDPTPDVVHRGRPFFYDARIASGHGNMSCASCHVFGDMDGLAWDLGNPSAPVERIPFRLTHANLILKPRNFEFHPMKGPMTTQSFRGMAESGAMHWRGDRHGEDDAPGDEIMSFRKFNPAFVDLNGRRAQLATPDMDAFAEFLFTVAYPPNPVQNLDRSMTGAQRAGFEFFTGDHLVDSGVTNCEGCHSLPLGTNGLINFEGSRSGQDFKAPHLRNLYEKVGRFNDGEAVVTGYGFTHDGAIGTLDEFLHADVFAFPGETETEQNAIRRQVSEYLLAFDTGTAPTVGQSLTLSHSTTEPDRQLLSLLMDRSRADDCALTAFSRVSGAAHAWLFDGAGFVPDRQGEARQSLQDLEAIARNGGQEVTFVCVPVADGTRSSVDRDLDGFVNRDEVALGTDPRDPLSVPNAPTATPTTDITETPGTPFPTPNFAFRLFVPNVSNESMQP